MSPHFAAALTSENHTLKRALTDPRLFSGIGNAYSDEILHRARLSPVTLTQRLSGERDPPPVRGDGRILKEWIARLRRKRTGGFPRRSLPSAKAWRCTAAIGRRARGAAPKSSGSATRRTKPTTVRQCQTGGKLLADRGLSRLLREDWPRTPEELESLLRRAD